MKWMICKYTYGMYLLRYILFIFSGQGFIHKGPLQAYLSGYYLQTAAESFDICLKWCTVIPGCLGISFRNSTSACAFYLEIQYKVDDPDYTSMIIHLPVPAPSMFSLQNYRL